MTLIKKLLGSLDTNTETPSFSARKLTALWFVILATYVHYQHLHKENAVEFLCIDVIAAFLCLAIINVADLVSLRTGNTTVTKQEITIKDTKTEPTPTENV